MGSALQTGNGTLERNELTESIVHYGTSENNLDLTANGTAEVIAHDAVPRHAFAAFAGIMTRT